jgi:hypothetical protein
MMAALERLLLCLASFFIVAGSVAYTSILVSTWAAVVGFVLARLPHYLPVNSDVMMEVCLHCRAFIVSFICGLRVGF